MDLGFEVGAAGPVIDLAVGLDSRPDSRPRFERDRRPRAAQPEPHSEIFEVQYQGNDSGNPPAGWPHAQPIVKIGGDHL